MSDARVQEPIATYLDWLRRSKNPNERREAALQLGERAYADAIPDLIRVYQKDKNKHVREAAAYALGMFRAAEIKLQTRDRDDVYELLEDVDEGELGSRADRGALIRRIVALALTLVALIAAYVLLPTRVPTVSLGPIQIASSLSEDAAPILADLREGQTKLRDNINNLRTELDALANGGSLSCQAFFNELFLYELSPAAAGAYPAIPPIVSDYNSGVRIFGASFARYDTACFGATALTADEARALSLGMTPAVEGLARMEANLTAAQTQPTPIPPTPIPPTDAPAVVPPTDAAPALPTDAPTADPAAPTADPALPTLQPTADVPTAIPTDAPTLEPTLIPTLTPGEGVFAPINAMYNIIDEVTSPRGAAALLVQYWQDVVDTGATTGCNAPRPTIPSDYTASIASDLPNLNALESARGLVNTALSDLRIGWTNLRGACNTGGLASQGQPELLRARNVLNNFTSARAALDALRALN
jgi:hypothetical protein